METKLDTIPIVDTIINPLPTIICNEPLSDSLIIGQIPDNGCGLFQEINQEIPSPFYGKPNNKLPLDVNLDGIADFQLIASSSISSSHHNVFLAIQSLDSSAFFGLFRQDYEVCILIDGPEPGYPAVDCRKSCNDFAPEEIGENQSTHLAKGFFQFAEGFESGTVFKNNLRWGQSSSFNRPSGGPSYWQRDCAREITIDKWKNNGPLYLPIKLVDKMGIVKLGWIKCKYDRETHSVFETFIQAY